MQETGSSFEKSMEELRSVVAKLESETLPLNESLSLFQDERKRSCIFAANNFAIGIYSFCTLHFF